MDKDFTFKVLKKELVFLEPLCFSPLCVSEMILKSFVPFTQLDLDNLVLKRQAHDRNASQI